MSELIELIPRDVPGDEEGLVSYLSQLVEQAKRVAASHANATLTIRNWLIGRAINTNILQNTRADYGRQIVATVSQQLTERFGPGLDRLTVFRMVQFAQLYPDG